MTPVRLPPSRPHLQHPARGVAVDPIRKRNVDDLHAACMALGYDARLLGVRPTLPPARRAVPISKDQPWLLTHLASSSQNQNRPEMSMAQDEQRSGGLRSAYALAHEGGFSCFTIGRLPFSEARHKRSFLTSSLPPPISQDFSHANDLARTSRSSCTFFVRPPLWIPASSRSPQCPAWLGRARTGNLPRRSAGGS